MSKLVYKGAKTKEISFPLGGIGTGCIGLSGSGRLIDWEVFNRPNKGSANGFSFFAVKVESNGQVMDSRVLHSDLPPGYMGIYGNSRYSGYGFGPATSTMAGLPHFHELEFEGEFPAAKLKFLDKDFPGNVTLTAFNPFIPLNDKDSGIPAAFFEFEIENTGTRHAIYTLCAALNNPHPAGTTVNRYDCRDAVHTIKLASTRYTAKDVEFGDMTVATDAPDASYQTYWYRGRWFDSLSVFWRDFTTAGGLKDRTYDRSDIKSKDVCSLAAHMDLEPGEKKSVRFVISWSFPNAYNYWNPESCECGSCNCTTAGPKTWKNYYATVFEDSVQSALYSIKNWNRLFSGTMNFKNALFSSTLPLALLDAISANLSILKTPTCLRLEDGSFYGFEGCHCTEGCCEGSCTHVWNYAYALPFLFPGLERSMRDLDYRYNMDEKGGMSFRLQLPPGRSRWKFRPCADGQFGGVIKAYRDWKICGDTEWLKSNWERIKKSIEYAWSESNMDGWDLDRDGVLEGRQHHTLDMELFGPNSWLTGFYLAALKAGAEMAAFLGETEKAGEYFDLFHKGSLWVDRNLFNGEYYFQRINLKDKAILEKYNEGKTLNGDSATDSYWNDEWGEIKYQIGEGCLADQVLAQWHANICGLGKIFDKAQTQKALESIYKYNFKRSMRNHFNPCRLYALNDEAGTVICEWPAGRYKPVVPAPYSEEAWSGCEYQAAAHMIQEGLLEEGLEIVQAVRNRYDGEKRNPWNEFECGSNYARSMASYSLLTAYSGFEFDMVKGLIGFNPVQVPNGEFSCFWSLDAGWGTFQVKEDRVRINVLYGCLKVKTLRLPFIKDRKIISVDMSGKHLDFSAGSGDILFAQPAEIGESTPLVIRLNK